MKIYRLEKEQQGELLLEELNVADTFIKRLRGLMGKTLEPSAGLLIKPCNSIHCFFMKIPIDVLFLDDQNAVIYKVENLRPWTVSPIIRGAKSVIEANVGAFHNIEKGDRLAMPEKK